MRTLLVSALLALAAVAAVPSAAAIEELPGSCGSSVGVCVWNHTPAGQCVGVHVGMQGAGACADAEDRTVRACSSMQTFLYDGNCPTDGIAADLTP